MAATPLRAFAQLGERPNRRGSPNSTRIPDSVTMILPRKESLRMRRFPALALLFLGAPLLFAKPRPCVPPDQAQQFLHKDVCIAAHVYDVVELPNGTRFLDICPPETSDDNCRFTVLSLWDDRDTVGELRKYRDTNVQIRGIVEPMHGRSGILLSHSRQFNGGPPRFRPNPRLARGFTAEQDRPALADPNLRTQGRGRAFMNHLDQQTMQQFIK